MVLLRNALSACCSVKLVSLSRGLLLFRRDRQEKLVTSRRSFVWKDKLENLYSLSLQDLLNLPHSFPGVTRRFWRASYLRPEDVLYLCVAFRCTSDKQLVKPRDAEFVWRLFNWAVGQSIDFQHLPQTIECMISLLVAAGMHREAESLLGKVSTWEHPFISTQVIAKIMDDHLAGYKLPQAVRMYNLANARSLVLPQSIYYQLLSFFVNIRETQLAYNLLLDMVRKGFRTYMEYNFELVIRALCLDGRVNQARNLFRIGISLGVQAYLALFNCIADGYCENKKFDYLIAFLKDQGHAPDPHICNKIVSSCCRYLGTKKAWFFLKYMEGLGFRSNAMSFTILVCWSCKEHRLKDGFIYSSECMSRGFKPNVDAYNALIACSFNVKLGKYAKDIFHDMIDMGITPNASTFQALAAGYCRSRQFDEVRNIASLMSQYHLLSFGPADDLLLKCFTFLDLDRVGVKIKRDNESCPLRAEFFDSLGNGLFLDTDTFKYNEILENILDKIIIPDLSHLRVDEYFMGRPQNALRLKSAMFQWGQRLSMSSYGALLEHIAVSRLSFDLILDVLDEMVELKNVLSVETLNLLLQITTRAHMSHHSTNILAWMLHKGLNIHNKSFTTLILMLCQKKDHTLLLKHFRIALSQNWLPEPSNWRALACELCNLAMVKEAHELFIKLSKHNSDSTSIIWNIFIEESCAAGCTSVGYVIAEEALLGGVKLGPETLSVLIACLCRDKKINKAFCLLDVMLEKNIVPSFDVSQLLVHKLCMSNKCGKALELVQLLMNSHPSAYVLVNDVFIYQFCKVHILEKSTPLLMETMKDSSDDSSTVGKMLHYFAQDDNLRGAMQLFCIFFKKKSSISVPIYRSLICLMCRGGKISTAFILKDFCLAEKHFPHLVLYNILIFYLFQIGRCLLVSKLLEEMHVKHIALNEATYNFLLYGYYKASLLPLSIKMFNTMIAKNMKPTKRGFRIATICFVGQGELKYAAGLRRMMESQGCGNCSIVKFIVASSFLFHGILTQAEYVIADIEAQQALPDASTCDILIKQLCEHNQLNLAVGLLNMVLKSGLLPSSRAYGSVISQLCIRGSLTEASDFHAEMIHKKLVPDLELSEMLVGALSTCGRVSEAEFLLYNLLNINQVPTANMYQMVINKCIFEHNISKAHSVLQEMKRNGYEVDFKTYWSLVKGCSKSRTDSDYLV